MEPQWPTLKQMLDSRIDPAVDTGGGEQRHIGWLCAYVPEEMIFAARMTPRRLGADGMGSDVDDTRAEAFCHTNTCSFVRQCCGRLLCETDAGLAGVVAGNSCDHIRRLLEACRQFKWVPRTFYLSIPHKITPDSRNYFRAQLSQLQTWIETVSGTTVVPADLERAIDLFNTTRRRLRRIYESRKAPEVCLSGAEMQTIVNAANEMPREAYNRRLAALWDEMQRIPRPPLHGPRVLITGSRLDQPGLFEEIESVGCVVVADALCTGSHYFWHPVDTHQAPLDALAERYLDNAACARFRPSDRRFDHIRRLIRDFRVQGVITQKVKFCDLYGFDSVLLRKALETMDIPLLEIEREYHGHGSGQMRTRVQAFIEILEAKG
jgi:benzoyl-CoA reductase subunit C